MFQPLFLKIFHRGKLLRIQPFTEEQISVGSGEGLNLILPGLAPWHVLIEKKLGTYIVFDLGSESGTLLDGKRVTGENELRSGSFITLGEYQIQFFVGPPPQTQSAAVPGGESSQPQEVVDHSTPTASHSQSAAGYPENLPPRQPVDPTVHPQQKAVGYPENLPPRQPVDPVAAVKSPLFSTVSQAAPSMSPPPLEQESSKPSSPENVSVPSYGEASDEVFPEAQTAGSAPLLPVKKSGLSDFSSPIGNFQKPDKKGFWKTFAPPEKIKNLDEFLTPSIGNFIEVIVAWKERILSSHHFSKGSVYMGAASECEVPVTNLMGLGKYKLLDIQGSAQIFFQGVSGALIQGKEKSTRTIQPIKGDRNVVLKPYEMVRLDFKNALKVYVRIKSKPTQPVVGRVFQFSLAEMSVLFFSFLLTGLLVFYSGFYAPLFLLEEEKFVEENIQRAIVKFTKPPRPVSDYKMKKRTRIAKKKAVAVTKKKKPSPRKKKTQASLPSKVKPKTKPKKMGLKALGRKKGRSSPSTRGKKKPKVAVGSIRPGGSLKTGKAGATAATVAPDPTKMGLLGVFGRGGKLKKLDQGATGSAAGGLVGLAESATGFSGTQEAYDGEGIGTRTKESGIGWTGFRFGGN